MLLLVLFACASPPSLPQLQGVLEDMGLPAAQDGERLSFDHTTPSRSYKVHLRLAADPPAVVLSTDGLWSLADAQGDAAAVVLVTQVATLNHELRAGRLSLDAATGAVEFTVDLPADEAVGDLTVRRAVERLLTTADALQPRLAGAR